MTDEQWMTSTASKYVTNVTFVPPPAIGWIQLLQRNPRRWRVTFLPFQGGGQLDIVLPIEGPPVLAVGGQQSSPLVSEFPKEPSTTTGEWWGNSQTGTGWIIIECLFTEER